MTKTSRKRKTIRVDVFSHAGGVWMVELHYCLGNMVTKSSTHQSSTPDLRVGVGLEVGVWDDSSPNKWSEQEFIHPLIHSIHWFTHSLSVFPALWDAWDHFMKKILGLFWWSWYSKSGWGGQISNQTIQCRGLNAKGEVSMGYKSNMQVCVCEKASWKGALEPSPDGDG